MNMKQFKYALVLANEGSFARAADALGVSQPNLSQYIKKIEQQVGMDLFDRTGSYVRLTDAGRVYIDIGKRILDLEHQMQSGFSDLQQYKMGSVVVGTSPYRSAGMMPIICKQFQNIYPGVHIVVEEMDTDELIDATEHGLLDLCLTICPVDERKFNTVKIKDEEYILAVPNTFEPFSTEMISGRKYPAIDVRDIDGKSFVMITENQLMQKALDALCGDFSLRLKRAVVVKSLEAKIDMVRAGVGMALVPSGIEGFCAPGEVTFYSFKQDLPHRDVVAIWRKDRKLNQITEKLLDVMKMTEW